MKRRISELFSQLRTVKQQAGFTMIELLIVIAILGILAVAVLSAINPVEQINRGRDTGSRSDAEQLLSAMDRFNAFQGYVPWRTGPNDGATSNTRPWIQLVDFNTVFDTGGTCAALEKLTTGNPTGAADTCTTHANELKETFMARITDGAYNHLLIYNGATTGDSTYVCFEPQSQAFITEATKRLDSDGNGTVDSVPSDYPSEAYSIGAAGTATAADCGPGLVCTCLP